MSRSTLVFKAICTSLTALVALSLTACEGDGPTIHQPPDTPAASYGGTLDLEIRGTAAVTITGKTAPEAALALTVTGAEAPHLLDDGTTLEGTGRFETFPEAATEMFVAKLSLPADPDGPCGSKPRAVAVALTHRTGAARFGGAVTVYCGDQHFGTPARVLRLSGLLDEQ